MKKMVSSDQDTIAVVERTCVKSNDPLLHADHIRGHAHTALLIGFERIHQIRHCLAISAGRLRGFLNQKQRISHDCSDRFLSLPNQCSTRYSG